MTWFALPGYEGIYAVSDAGEVMSMNYAGTGLPGLLRQRSRRGYLAVPLCAPGRKERSASVHSLVMAAFVGPRAVGAQINHKNGDKADNRLCNLEYCSASENKFHAFAAGLQSNAGESHSQALLTDEVVIDIRARLARGEKQTDIARAYGVTQPAISLVKTGKRWAHVRKVG